MRNSSLVSQALSPPGPLPNGTVTFLFTDVEGPTRLLQAHPDAYQDAIRRHHDLLKGAVTANVGTVFETVCDVVYAAFARPTDAAKAACDGQRALRAETWSDISPIRVHMGTHLGEVELHEGHYFGVPLYRCARLMSAAHGSQTVVSEVAAAALLDSLQAGTGRPPPQGLAARGAYLSTAPPGVAGGLSTTAHAADAW